MTKKEIELLRIEEDFRDTIENELNEKNKDLKNKKIEIKDIKFVGDAIWNDKINQKPLTEKVFLVNIKMTEIDKEGKDRITEQELCYFGNECIGGRIGEGQIAFKQSFENSEPNKIKAIKDLLEKISEQELENNSLTKIQTKEMQEVLSAHLGRNVSKEEVEKLLEDINTQENEDLLENIDEEDLEDYQEEKDIDEEKLTKRQTEKIKVNGLQKVDLNRVVDGKEKLGRKLDLEEYDNMYVVYSEKVKDIKPGTKVNNTTYSLVGMTKEGEAKVLDNEFEMDKSVGNYASREQTKIRANSTATRDNKDLSVYTRKSNGISIGCENDKGIVNMFMYQKTKEENENVGMQIETSQTPVIPLETREIMNKSKGMYQADKIQDEVKQHTDEGCKPEDVKDFDGNENTATHIDINSQEINENDYIPNTDITWSEFESRCGYRGEGALEKAVEKINELEEVNQDTIEKFIEEQEEDYIKPERGI